MKKIRLYSIFAAMAVLSLTFLSGCGDDTVDPIDESAYPGVYVGYHHLDSAALESFELGEPGDFSYWDTLTVSYGSDSTDGKLKAVSSLLNGKTIEVNITLTSNNVAPVFFGDITILGKTIQNSKITSGTATWDAGKTTISTRLFVTVDFPFGSTLITIPGLKLDGSFVRQ